MVKNPHAMWETRVQSLGLEDALEKGMAPHSSVLAWWIPWTEELGRLQSLGLKTAGQDWATNTFRIGIWSYFSLCSPTQIAPFSFRYMNWLGLLSSPLSWPRDLSTGPKLWLLLWSLRCLNILSTPQSSEGSCGYWKTWGDGSRVSPGCNKPCLSRYIWFLKKEKQNPVTQKQKKKIIRLSRLALLAAFSHNNFADIIW